MPLSILAGAAGGLAEAGAQQAFTDYNREEDYKLYEKAQQKNFERAQEMNYLAPLQTSLGMAAAGLNPSGSNPSSSSMTAAPLATHVSPTPTFAADTLALAQSRLANSEAEKLDLQNAQTQHANQSSFQNYKNQLESVISLYSERGFKQQAEKLQDELDSLLDKKTSGNLDWNLGDLEGAVKAFGSIDKMQERLEQQLKRQFETETNFNLLVNGQSFEVAKMPALQREMLEKQISVSAAQAVELASRDKLNLENIDYLLKQQNKIDFEVQNLVEQKKLTKAQAELISNSDWKSLFANGQYKQGAVAFLDDYTKQIIHVLGQIIGAVGGIKTGQAIAKKIGTKTIQHEYVPQNPNGSYYGTKPQTPTHRRTFLSDGVPLGSDDYDQ